MTDDVNRLQVSEEFFGGFCCGLFVQISISESLNISMVAPLSLRFIVVVGRLAKVSVNCATVSSRDSRAATAFATMLGAAAFPTAITFYSRRERQSTAGGCFES